MRRRILRAFVGRGLLESFEAKEMLAYRHSGFSVDASVHIEAHDRAGLERLLRYCARPALSMERLRKAGSALVYRCAKQHSEPECRPFHAVRFELGLPPEGWATVETSGQVQRGWRDLVFRTTSEAP